ncbi:glycosyltransferase family 2 protein [Spirosoma humi]
MNKISVCLASYNGERYIKQQLNSILLQLNSEDEVIVSDDGSSDNTIKVICSLQDQRIKIYNNSGPRGPLSNFESALERATGDYIFLADQDDIWLPDKILIYRPLLDKYDLVLSDCHVVDKEGVMLKKSFFDYRGSRPGFWYNIYKNSYMGCCMAFRREIFSYILPFPKNIYMHDWWIGLLVEVRGSVFFCHHPTINYVRHGSNASPTGEAGYSYQKKLVNRFIMLLNITKRLAYTYFV